MPEKWTLIKWTDTGLGSTDKVNLIYLTDNDNNVRGICNASVNSLINCMVGPPSQLHNDANSCTSTLEESIFTL